MIHVRIDWNPRKNKVVFRDRFKNLFPRLKLVTVSAERTYTGVAR
jgi:hypothetical protein